MTLELFERLVRASSVIAILAVAAPVGVFGFVIPQSSGISREEATAASAVATWLEDARREASGAEPVSLDVPILDVPPAPRGPDGEKCEGAAPQQSYFVHEGEAVSEHEHVPGIPFVRRQPGVVYMPPRVVPEIVHRRYQGLEEANEAANQASGELVDGKLRLTWVAPDSALATTVGLRAGDRIVSVNGHPIGSGVSAGRRLYDALKDEKRFAVKIVRDGREVVLSFAVR